VVVDIRLADTPGLQRRSGSKNVFGEDSTDDDVINPYFRIVVRMTDNALLTTTAYPATILDDLELASSFYVQKRDIQQHLASLVGTVIYPVAYSVVFPPNADLTVLTDGSRAVHQQRIPNLTPLTITKAAYVESEHAVVLKVQYDGSKSGIVFEWYNR